jgi:multidrug efflux pump subunit AcrB
MLPNPDFPAGGGLDSFEEGQQSLEGATERAARIRYRPVMMTALAFIVGVVPLVVANGAGAGARRSIGTTVFGGMVVASLASLVGVLFVPALFVMFERLAQWIFRRARHVPQS